MTDSVGVNVYHYDTAGRVTDEDRTIGGVVFSTGYSYLADGSLASMTYPTGRVVTYTRGATGALSSMSAQLGTQNDTLISATCPGTRSFTKLGDTYFYDPVPG